MVIARALVSALVFVAGQAHAVWDMVGDQRYADPGFSFNYSTAPLFCSGEATRRFGGNATGTVTSNPENASTGQMTVNCDWTGGALGSQHTAGMGIGYCVTGGARPGGGGGCWVSVASCTAPQVPDANGLCHTPPCTAGVTTGSGYFDIGTDPTKHPLMAGCMDGCQVAFDGVSPAGNALVDGVKHYFSLGQYVTTGAECTTGTNPGSGAPDVPPSDCADGQVLGEVNGQPVCAVGDTGDSVVPPQTETTTTTKTPPVDNGDGTTTETETTTKEVTNPDGSTGTQATTTTTTCDQAGNCEITTETETTGSYVDPEDAGQEEDAPSECELHPNTAGCAELDTPTGPDLPTSNVSISGVSPQSGWGADNATCPALVHTVSLGDVDVFGLICTYMQGIRFLVIGISWLIAALIFVGRTD